jgi:rubredoxin
MYFFPWRIHGIEIINSPIHAILYWLKKNSEIFDMMEKYICAVCGHVFDPEKGEPLQNIPQGREFADLLETWQCPICGASKKNFRKE